jgi:hypothetical protein
VAHVGVRLGALHPHRADAVPLAEGVRLPLGVVPRQGKDVSLDPMQVVPEADDPYWLVLDPIQLDDQLARHARERTPSRSVLPPLDSLQVALPLRAEVGIEGVPVIAVIGANDERARALPQIVDIEGHRQGVADL